MDREERLYKQAGLLASLISVVGKPTAALALGSGRLAAKLIQGVASTAVKHPILFGAPLLGTIAGSYLGTRTSPSATLSWVDPRKNEYRLRPGILYDKLEKNR